MLCQDKNMATMYFQGINVFNYLSNNYLQMKKNFYNIRYE